MPQEGFSISHPLFFKLIVDRLYYSYYITFWIDIFEDAIFRLCFEARGCSFLTVARRGGRGWVFRSGCTIGSVPLLWSFKIEPISIERWMICSSFILRLRGISCDSCVSYSIDGVGSVEFTIGPSIHCICILPFVWYYLQIVRRYWCSFGYKVLPGITFTFNRS